ncbi:MAG: hypothetical protein U0T83_11435 [Bacteriovoracaceae bacterium]
MEKVNSISKSTYYRFKLMVKNYLLTIDFILKLGGGKNIAIGSDRGAPFSIDPNFYSNDSLNLLKTNLSVDFNLDDFVF